MPLLSFDSLAGQLPVTWKSSVVGQVGSSRIKVLRMDEQAYAQESHDYNEGLLVISGCLQLDVAGQTVKVQSGEMYLVEAGVVHSVAAGSYGTLMIIDV